jgi:hypothetical protein
MADESADDRWTVRGVPKGVRDAVADAAQRGKLTVGMWLCRAIDREIQAEREPLDLLVTRPVADKSSDRSDNLSDSGSRLALIERAVDAAVALAGAAEVPAGFRRRANRLLRDSLPPATPRKVSSPRLLIDGAAHPPANGAGADA